MQTTRLHHKATKEQSVNANSMNVASNSTFAKHQKQPGHFNFDFNALPIQAKLKINTPGDRYEQEADSIADKVVSMNAPVSVNQQSNKQINRKSLIAEISTIDGISAQRKCAACKKEDEEIIQRKASTIVSPISSDNISSQINATRGGGNAMDNETNQYMSSRFGVDFSSVNIHNNARAAQISQNINARAFTVGNDIYFNKGEYNPETSSGKRLLAHELVHTVQQHAVKSQMIQKTDNEGFYDYFKECMDALGLPTPNSLFSSITTATATIGAITGAVTKFGAEVTILELIGAGVLSEVLIAAGALTASFYVGACIGCLATATGQSISG